VEIDLVNSGLVCRWTTRPQPGVHLHPARLAELLELQQPLRRCADNHLHVQAVVHISDVAFRGVDVFDFHAVSAHQPTVFLDGVDLDTHVVVAY